MSGISPESLQVLFPVIRITATRKHKKPEYILGSYQSRYTLQLKNHFLLQTVLHVTQLILLFFFFGQDLGYIESSHSKNFPLKSQRTLLSLYHTWVHWPPGILNAVQTLHGCWTNALFRNLYWIINKQKGPLWWYVRNEPPTLSAHTGLLEELWDTFGFYKRGTTIWSPWQSSSFYLKKLLSEPMLILWV